MYALEQKLDIHITSKDVKIVFNYYQIFRGESYTNIRKEAQEFIRLVDNYLKDTFDDNIPLKVLLPVSPNSNGKTDLEIKLPKKDDLFYILNSVQEGELNLKDFSTLRMEDTIRRLRLRNWDYIINTKMKDISTYGR